ncbi:adherens junction organization [Homalodisca vitripennis]|nr:adherens junction organization [Homalodisca vitripennis]
MVPGARVKCYKIPPDNDLCLCEDIFQQHQAKLVNCDSEDADAISRNREVDSQSKDDSNSIKSNQFNNPKADVVRYQRKDQGTDVMSPKWQYRSLDNISDVSKEDRFAGWVPLPGMRKCKSDFYLSRDGEWKMVNGKDDLKDAFSEEIRVYNLSERQTECYKEILEAVVSSTSTSECGCDNDSVSPKSTDSSSISSGTLTLKPTSNKGNCEINSNNQNKTLTSKLSAEERDKALKELDEIVSGSFLKKISDFGQGVTYSGSTRDKMSEFLSDMLKLDLSSLKNSSSDNSDPKSNPSSEDEMLQFGCGRVAALAKHFSRMGEAGIIRGRGGNYNRAGRGRGLSRNSFRSEPNIAELSKDWLLNPHPDDIIIPAPLTENDKNSSHFQMIFTSFGLHPVGFSMDRLLDIGTQGVVLKEINSGKAEEVINEQEIDSKNETKHTIEDIILEGNYNDPEIENFITNPRARGMRFNSWTQTSDSIDLTNEPEQKESCAYQKALENFEKKVQKNSLTNFKKKSLSLDNCTNNISKSKPIDLKKKSISVDEIELRKMRKPPLQKHYSFVDLGSIDNDNQELLEDDKVGVMSSIGCKRLNGFRERRGKFCSSEEINKQYGMKDDISKDMSIRKWLSVDEAAQMSELSFKAEKLDTGTIKDSLRKIHKSGEGMGRKLKRMKKIDQKVFVVSPLRHSEMSPGDGVVSVFTSDDDCSPVWSARRNSVPASLLHNEMQEPFRKL